MKVKRWFIRKDVDPNKFVQAIKLNKYFTPKHMRQLVKFIFELGVDRMICPGVKKRRRRKKIIKQEVKYFKEDLQFQILDMMEEKLVEAPNPQEDEECKQAFRDLIEKYEQPKDETNP